MDKTVEPGPEPDGEEMEVGAFRPEDAEGMVRLFRTVYGEQYPIRLFYDPRAIIDANASGRYYSIVARTATGRIAGVTHLFRSAPYPSTYENGVGLVLKEYRNTRAFSRLNEYLFGEFIPGRDNIEETFGEAVCNHVYTQKSGLRFGHVFTALEVALMPAAAYAKENSASGRVAALCMFRTSKIKPHRIYLPAAYEGDLRWIYSRLADPRDMEVSRAAPPAGRNSRITIEIFGFAHVARLAVHEIGPDFRRAFERIEVQAISGGAVVLQAWLDLTHPWVGAAVDALRGMGYFFGGALPRWFDGDGMLMQKLRCPPDFDAIVLAEADSRKLQEIIRSDWERADAMGR